jgi:hypothetical protein
MSDTKLALPLGRAIYPALKRPDTKFNELGIYKANVSVPLKEAAGVMEQLSNIYKQHTGKAPAKADNTMWKLEVDEETGEETGNVIFKCTVKNVLRNGVIWDRRPKQFDAKMNPIDVDPRGGSEMYVSASVYAWSAGGKKGVTIQPLAIQVINLIEGIGSNPESYGFQKRDGFEAADLDDNNFNGGTDDEPEAESEDF